MVSSVGQMLQIVLWNFGVGMSKSVLVFVFVLR